MCILLTLQVFFALHQLFYSACYRQNWQITSKQLSLKKDLIEKEDKCSGCESFMTFCSQLKRALLRYPIIDHCPSAPVSAPRSVFFNHSISLETHLCWLWPWFTAAFPRSTSIEVHPPYLLGLMSLKAYWMYRGVTRQTGAEFYLCFIQSMSTYSCSDVSLSQKRASSDPPTMVGLPGSHFCTHSWYSGNDFGVPLAI